MTFSAVGLQMLINQDATIDGQSAGFGEFYFGDQPDRRQNNIRLVGGTVAVGQAIVLRGLFKLGDTGIEVISRPRFPYVVARTRRFAQGANGPRLVARDRILRLQNHRGVNRWRTHNR